MKPVSEYPVGFQIIREMTKEELMEEIAQNQRAQLEEMELPALRHIVADFRIKEATKRIHSEAGLKSIPGILGSVVVGEDDDDE